jgi:hypothetical protein
MEKFNLYSEALIFVSVFAVIVLIPCYFVFLIGRNMMEEMGRFPTRAAFIQAKALLTLMVVEVGAFLFLTSFYRIFAN